MSDQEDNTATTVPSVLITSCDVAFKEEDLIKRKLGWDSKQAELTSLASRLHNRLDSSANASAEFSLC